MDTQKAIDTIKGLKQTYDNYSQAFDVAIKQLEGTLVVQLIELEDTKAKLTDAQSQIIALTPVDVAPVIDTPNEIIP